MNTPVVGIIAFCLLLVVLALGLPIGLAMALMGFIGMAVVVNLNAAIGLFATTPFTFVGDYMMSSLPLFILMGAFAYRAGIITDAYNAAQKWLSRLPGGLSIATIAGCAGFGACTGSAAATVGFMTMATLPEMERFKYDPRLATGTIAAGSTLGILIPPSVPLIVYGLFAQESIGRLFISGIIPGIVLMLLFMGVTIAWVIWKPEAGRPGPGATWKERWKSLGKVFGLLILALLVSGGIWAGWFTPVEAGGIGSAGALIIGLAMRRMTWKAFTDSLTDTAKLTGMVFVIVVGAQILNQFLAITNLPIVAAQSVADSGLGAIPVLAIIVVFYIIGGCLMDSMGLMLLTMPILIPIVRALGVDMTMYGILMVVMIAMAGITPPVGMNVFILAATARHIPMYTIFKGAMPYFIAMFVLTVLIIAFPEICTWLPNTMIKGP
jgi:tripartite ATP-independent transporter DctM subunit